MHVITRQPDFMLLTRNIKIHNIGENKTLDAETAS